MAGYGVSEDVMKVVPDESRIPPGYLYAFLSSKYGVPLVVAGTYGAIIQHIEPEHIANLPVPRLGNDFELHVSGLIQKAAEQRALASNSRRAAIAAFETLLCWERLDIHRLFRSASSADVLRRMDAFYHSAKVAQGIESAFETSQCASSRQG
jgi:type I restriction enzyme S subunit